MIIKQIGPDDVQEALNTILRGGEPPKSENAKEVEPFVSKRVAFYLHQMGLASLTKQKLIELTNMYLCACADVMGGEFSRLNDTDEPVHEEQEAHTTIIDAGPKYWN